ncbi:MAG: hypothetical protein KGI09_02505 [Thaumarchaeota archaeon]|nr:hypothetical protein [Nitrososphaerota archaeon]
MSGSKATSNRKQGIKNEKKQKILGRFDVENYSHILYPIEFAIASYHVENPNITDEMLLKEIMSFGSRYRDEQNDAGNDMWKKIKTDNAANKNSRQTKIKDGLTIALEQATIQGLKEGPITRGEFLSCLGYVAYCIDNRSWIPEGRGYLDWITNWFGLLEGRKKQEFDYFYEEISKILGIEKGLLKDEHYT